MDEGRLASLKGEVRDERGHDKGGGEAAIGPYLHTPTCLYIDGTGLQICMPTMCLGVSCWPVAHFLSRSQPLHPDTVRLRVGWGQKQSFDPVSRRSTACFDHQLNPGDTCCDLCEPDGIERPQTTRRQVELEELDK